MLKIRVLAIFFSCTSFIALAKKPNIAIYYDQFFTPDGEPYIETYFSLDPLSITLKEAENGMYKGGIKISLIFEHEGRIVAFDKLLLETTEIKDTNEPMPYVLQFSRLSIAEGNYDMKIELQDINGGNEPILLEQNMDVSSRSNELNISNIMLLDSYKTTEAPTEHSKFGLELVPIVPVGSYFLPEQYTALPIYFEIANADSALGKNEPFIVKYYLIDNNRKMALNDYSGFKKVTTASVNPVITNFDISSLQSGYYSVAVEIISRENTIVKRQQTAFYRSNPKADEAIYDLTKVLATQNFAYQIADDSLEYFVRSLYPTATLSERRFAENVLLERNYDLMRRFMYVFWRQRDALNPEQAWLGYKTLLNYADEQFGSSTKPGYLTDMGRVLLQYGQPTYIERNDYNQTEYPWQIWQYDALQSASTPLQNNRLFVFADQTLTGRSYSLIHSNAIAEIADYKWRYTIIRRSQRGTSVDDSSINVDRDVQGSRINNNFIIGDHRYWPGR